MWRCMKCRKTMTTAERNSGGSFCAVCLAPPTYSTLPTDEWGGMTAEERRAARAKGIVPEDPTTRYQ